VGGGFRVSTLNPSKAHATSKPQTTSSFPEITHKEIGGFVVVAISLFSNCFFRTMGIKYSWF